MRMTMFCLNRATCSKIFRPPIAIHKSTVFAVKPHNDYIKEHLNFANIYLIRNDLEMGLTFINVFIYVD
jgi:hypothetical protein